MRPTTRAPSSHSGRRSAAVWTWNTRAQWRAARVGQFAGVVAAGAADDDDDVAAPRQRRAPPPGAASSARRPCRPRGPPPRGKRCRMSDARRCNPLDGLRGLGDDAEPGPRCQAAHVLLVQHHVERVEVLGQPAHLHVVPPADDDRVEAVARHRHHRARAPCGRGSRWRPAPAGPRSRSGRQPPVGRAVRGDHHVRRLDVADVAAEPDRRGRAGRRAPSRCAPARPARSAAAGADSCAARAMASRTPKHMPRWRARMTLIGCTSVWTLGAPACSHALCRQSRRSRLGLMACSPPGYFDLACRTMRSSRVT